MSWSPAPRQDSRTENLEVLLLGGLPIREQIAWYGPFVMNTRDELVQAVEDYQAGRMGRIPAKHAEPEPPLRAPSHGRRYPAGWGGGH